MITWPGEPPGNTSLSAWCRKFLRAAKYLELREGPGYTVSNGPNGTILGVRPGSGGAPAGAVRYRLKSVQANYVTCRTWDGTNEGSTDVYIAKPARLRESVTSEVIFGTTYNMTYANGPGGDTNNRYRTATNASDSTTESQLVLPVWLANEEIFAFSAQTGVTTAGGAAVSLLMLAEGRMWTEA